MVSWIVQQGAFDGEYSGNVIDLDLMRGNYGSGQLEGTVKTGMENTAVNTLWQVNGSTPVGNGYFLRLYSNNRIQCFSPMFSIKEFNGDSGTNSNSMSHKGVPMVIPAAPVPNNRKRSILENVVASSSSSSRKADSSVTNLIAGLLVFGAFL